MLEPLGLTHPQYLVMLALWESSPRSLGELADELAMDPATSRPSSRGSRRRGRVVRSRRTDDERILDIALTEEGARCAPSARRFRCQIMARYGMDVAELDSPSRGLAPVRRSGVSPCSERSRIGSMLRLRVN